MNIDIRNGDCLEILKTFPDNYFHSVVTDPPYGIFFMQKKWDYQIPSVEVWKEVLRVLKCGGHILVACGTRTQHRMVVNIEDAGFEIKDVITWHYGSGFPHSLNISKAIDKQAGATREVIGKRQHPTLKDKSKVDRQSKHQYHSDNPLADEWDITAPSTEEAKKWDGWGTALKPATEFWTLARKPLGENTIAENVIKNETGGINIDESRVDFTNETDKRVGTDTRVQGSAESKFFKGIISGEGNVVYNKKGRFPANVIFDDVTGKILDEQSGHLKSGSVNPEGFKGEYKAKIFGKYSDATIDPNCVYADEGGASRFFYCAKPSRSERNKGTKDGNKHPTVKPVKLMTYLVKLITPPNGIVLDLFAGSGTTGIPCKIHGFGCVLIERDKDSCDTIKQRIDAWDVEKSIDDQMEFDF